MAVGPIGSPPSLPLRSQEVGSAKVEVKTSGGRDDIKALSDECVRARGKLEALGNPEDAQQAADWAADEAAYVAMIVITFVIAVALLTVPGTGEASDAGLLPEDVSEVMALMARAKGDLERHDALLDSGASPKEVNRAITDLIESTDGVWSKLLSLPGARRSEEFQRHTQDCKISGEKIESLSKQLEQSPDPSVKARLREELSWQAGELRTLAAQLAARIAGHGPDDPGVSGTSRPMRAGLRV